MGARPSPANTILAAAVVASTPGTATAIVTPNKPILSLDVRNTLDTDVMLSYDGAAWLFIPAGVSFVRDYTRYLLDGEFAIGIYHLGSAPTAGRLVLTLEHMVSP